MKTAMSVLLPLILTACGAGLDPQLTENAAQTMDVTSHETDAPDPVSESAVTDSEIVDAHVVDAETIEAGEAPALEERAAADTPDPDAREEGVGADAGEDVASREEPSRVGEEESAPEGEEASAPGSERTVSATAPEPLIVDAHPTKARPPRVRSADKSRPLARRPVDLGASAKATPRPTPPVKSTGAPRDSDEALGSDPEDALGHLMGGSVGDSAGYGGLGLRGTGRGGGGTGAGTIGLGSLGTVGHGAGGGSGRGYGRGSAGVGYGRGSGGLRGRRAPSRRRVRAGSPSIVSPAAPAHGREMVRSSQPRTTILTAATVPDCDRRAAYLSYLSRHPREALALSLDLTRRVRFRVIDAGNRPIHDARVTLVSSTVRLEGRTRADGFWDVFPSLSAPNIGGSSLVYVQTQGRTTRAQVELPSSGDARDIYIRIPGINARGAEALDLAFLIDVTGSMGDELQYVTEEIVGIVATVREAMPQVNIRLAATLYRDRQDWQPLAQVPFTNDVAGFAQLLGRVRAGGGGDYPEDLNSGLAAAMRSLAWNAEPAARVLVLIADAPPQQYHDAQYTYREAMLEASARGIRILPVAASGADRVVEYLFRAMGAQTGTPYVYLTDDSGVGNPHMEADTDRIAVEMFSDLLTRLLISDLRGRGMHEPEHVSQLENLVSLRQ